jgi:hypothetical protein
MVLQWRIKGLLSSVTLHITQYTTWNATWKFFLPESCVKNGETLPQIVKMGATLPSF